MLRPTHLLMLAILTVALAPPSAFAADTPSADPLRFGAPVTVKKSVKISKLAKQPERFAGKTVRLEGTVKDVCQGRGCWIEVATDKGESFMAKSLDESVLVPKDCKGRKVVVQGVVTKMPVKEHEHAEGEAEEGHTCPRPVYVVSTQGVELEPAK